MAFNLLDQAELVEIPETHCPGEQAPLPTMGWCQVDISHS